MTTSEAEYTPPERGYEHFLRGFADGAGITIGAARSYWEEQVKQLQMSAQTREKIESQGYSAGLLEAARWQRNRKAHQGTGAG